MYLQTEIQRAVTLSCTYDWIVDFFKKAPNNSNKYVCVRALVNFLLKWFQKVQKLGWIFQERQKSGTRAEIDKKEMLNA